MRFFSLIKTMPHQRFIEKHFDFIPRDFWACLLIVLVTLTVYWQVHTHEFINFDDPIYITENTYVRQGLTADSFRWAFSLDDKQQTYWHPITWLSHMLDVRLYGLAAGRHLLNNVFIHICNALLLFCVLRRMTSAWWPCVLVSLLFALHPLNVETVAWVTGRKSVLSTFFWMLSLLAYHRYTARTNTGRYLLVLLAFSLGLMSKPMLVTLPLVFLLLDFWPLGRLGSKKTNGLRLRSRVLHLTAEKIPFFLLSAGSIWVSSLSLQRHDSFISLTAVPLGVRVGNAFVSYVVYLRKIILPDNLSVFYPYPKMVPFWQVVAAVLILAGLTAVVIRYYHSKPYLLVGWLWYLGTLLPVLGLVQAGLWPAMADRFVYVPMIGLGLMTVWSAAEFLGQNRFKTHGAAVSVVILLSLMVASSLQVGHWKNSISLFEQALRADGNNALAHNNLGVALRKQGRIGAAISHYDAALDLKPDYPAAHHNLGLALIRVGQLDEAIGHIKQALKLDPEFTSARKSLQTALAARRARNQKIAAMQTAIERTPDNPELHYRLGNLYDQAGDRAGAITHYHRALTIRSDFSQALNNLAIVHVVNGDYDEAMVALQRLVSLKPRDPNVHYLIASVLARQNKVDECIDWLQSAVRNGFKGRNRILTDKNLENIRNNHRYQEWIQGF